MRAPMSTIFKCENCLTETKVSRGVISIVCQSCGCFDVKFDRDVILIPSNHGDIPNPVSSKAGEPFLGMTPRGCIWDLSFPNPVNNPLPISEEDKPKEEDDDSEIVPKLLRSSRKK